MANGVIVARVAFQYKLKTRLDLVYSAITAIGAAEKGKLDYANLLACYRSGQVSEAQWHQHLSDPAFAAWLKDAEAKTQK